MVSEGRDDGRRGARDRVVAWAPGFAVPEDQEPTTVAEPEPSEPSTLGELDLAVTPVSVTPPRTWRRAAWFAVGASCVVLVVLVFVAARLAGPDSPFDRIDAFPGLPTGGLLTAQPPEPANDERPTATAVQHGGGEPATDGRTRPTVAGAPDNGPTAGPNGQQGGSPGPGAATPTAGGPGGESVAPTVSVLPSTGNPQISAEQLIEATTSFYAVLPKNVDAAWDKVGPRVQAQGFASFRRHWGSAAEIQLQKVVVDGDGVSVLSTIRVVNPGGVGTVQNYRFAFRQGSPLLIDQIDQLDAAGIQPAG